MTGPRPSVTKQDQLSLLFVCTGNICRSPMAAAMAEAKLKSRVPGLSVRSTGRLSPGRVPTAPMLQVMSKRGFDLSSHVSSTLDAALEEPPDLVIGMAREHVREVVDHRPELFDRTFTFFLTYMGIGSDELVKVTVRDLTTGHAPKIDPDLLLDSLNRITIAVGAGVTIVIGGLITLIRGARYRSRVEMGHM